jgi:hypothetical protein
VLARIIDCEHMSRPNRVWLVFQRNHRGGIELRPERQRLQSAPTRSGLIVSEIGAVVLQTRSAARFGSSVSVQRFFRRVDVLEHFSN